RSSFFTKFLWWDAPGAQGAAGAAPALARQALPTATTSQAPQVQPQALAAASPARPYEVTPLGPDMGQLDIISGKFDGTLVTSSLGEQFDRARTYVVKYPEHFSARQRATLQNWASLVEGRAATADVLMACKALYVLEVTRSRPEWSAADEGDTTFAGPEAVIVQVRNAPTVASLTTLKECLDYCSREWLDMYCRLDGAKLLLDVLRTHEAPARQGYSEAVEALVVTLQCIQSLTSKPGGMTAVLAVRGFTRALAGLMRSVDSDVARLVLELFTKMMLFSDQSYRQVMITLLGLPESAARRLLDAAATATVGDPTGSDVSQGSTVRQSEAQTSAAAAAPPPGIAPGPKAAYPTADNAVSQHALGGMASSGQPQPPPPPAAFTGQVRPAAPPPPPPPGPPPPASFTGQVRPAAPPPPPPPGPPPPAAFTGQVRPAAPPPPPPPGPPPPGSYTGQVRPAAPPPPPPPGPPPPAAFTGQVRPAAPPPPPPPGPPPPAAFTGQVRPAAPPP
ncbi:hypothetical protein Vretimale_733, partial [Volvox reticuliferus]